MRNDKISMSTSSESAWGMEGYENKKSPVVNNKESNLHSQINVRIQPPSSAVKIINNRSKYQHLWLALLIYTYPRRSSPAPCIPALTFACYSSSSVKPDSGEKGVKSGRGGPNGGWKWGMRPYPTWLEWQKGVGVGQVTNFQDEPFGQKSGLRRVWRNFRRKIRGAVLSNFKNFGTCFENIFR